MFKTASVKFIKRIKTYAITSFLVPLLAINACLLLYKLLGDIGTFHNIDWDKEKIELTINEYQLFYDNKSNPFTFTNCPKYKPTFTFTTDSEAILLTPENSLVVNELVANNKIKSVIIKHGKILNEKCIKNYQLSYLFLKKFSLLEAILVNTVHNSTAGFAKIKNPYFYGEVSISRTARYFPATLIFKTLIISSSLLLFLYWKNNLNLFTELKNKNILVKFSKKFFYFGVFSCIFLALHAIFLGLDFDSRLFSKMRRLIIILFIVAEVCAQIYLTSNLFKYKKELKEYINPIILIIKIIFVTTVFFISCAAFAILSFGDPSSAFKHTLEWNYFAFLLLYYLLSRLLWNK